MIVVIGLAISIPALHPGATVGSYDGHMTSGISTHAPCERGDLIDLKKNIFKT